MIRLPSAGCWLPTSLARVVLAAVPILVVALGCSGEGGAGTVVVGASVDLVARSKQALEAGVWNPRAGVRIEPIRVGQLTKRSVRVPSGPPVVLPPAEGRPGMELWLACTLDAAAVPTGPVTLRVTGRAIPREGEPAENGRGEPPSIGLLELVLEPDQDAGRWRHASIRLPAGLDDNLALGLEVASEETATVLVGDLVLVTGRGGTQDAHGPNVLLITLDTLRADHLPAYGYEKDTAPFLTQLAGRMTVYERAYSPSTWTLPAHASLFTGLLPGQHKAISAAGEIRGGALPRELTTLAEILDERGYLTLGIVSGPMLKRHFALDQGFAFYSDDVRRADAVTDLALEWVDRTQGRPYFLFLNYFDAHLPLDPPGYVGGDEELFERVGIDLTRFQWEFMGDMGLESIPPDVNAAMLARYDAEIRFLDTHLERLFHGLERRGLLEDTIVCIVGDHGESYGETGFWGHGGSFLESQAHVPFFYGDRRQPLPAQRAPEPISTLEIPALILADMGIPSPIPGFELRARPVYGERFTPWGSHRMVYDGRYLYLVNFFNAKSELKRVTERLFDLEADPQGVVDIAPEGGEPLSSMRQKLSVLMRQGEISRAGQASLSPPGVDVMTEELRALKAQLQELGYAGDG